MFAHCLYNDMATTNFFLDARRGDAPYPLKLRLTHNRQSVYFSLNIRLDKEQWVGTAVVKHPSAAMLNRQLLARKAEIDLKLYDLERDGKIRGKSAAQIKKMLEGDVEESDFFAYFEKAMARRSKNTQKVYKDAMKRIKDYDAGCSFDGIDKDWLRGFDVWLAKRRPSANSRSIIMRTLRAVFNDALDDEVTRNYPFRKFKIAQEPTRKRCLSLQELNNLKSFPVEEYQRRYRDLFVLMILMRGINIGDLCLLRDSDVVNGRIEYVRQKTHKKYSIKIEPEMWEIIQRYKGERYLINVMDSYNNYEYFKARMNRELKKIGEVTCGKRGKKDIVSMFPDLSTYWARHTFATIAHAECGVSIEVIADMLGHSNGYEVTNIYIKRNEKITDEAARKVIDKVMYGK